MLRWPSPRGVAPYRQLEALMWLISHPGFHTTREIAEGLDADLNPTWTRLASLEAKRFVRSWRRGNAQVWTVRADQLVYIMKWATMVADRMEDEATIVTLEAMSAARASGFRDRPDLR